MNKIENNKLETEYKRTIYVDMDGVIVDFDKGYFNIFKKYPKEDGDRLLWIKINKYGKTKFFSELVWMEDGIELWNFITSNFLNVKICTSLGGSDGKTALGKMTWLKQNIPTLLDKDIIMVKNKHKKQEYSKPEDIIIDDTLVVIEEWRQQGGISIHHKSAIDTICKLKKYV